MFLETLNAVFLALVIHVSARFSRGDMELRWALCDSASKVCHSGSQLVLIGGD